MKPETQKKVAHWVVITGVSLPALWDRNWSDPNKNPWRWIRVFNPWRGITEYYWSRDFNRSWNGVMVRVDPATLRTTCDIKEGGKCY